jgi:anti-sigma regulatory factor (Ser/Thr protein kinase)
MTNSPAERPIRLTIFSLPTHLAVVRGAVEGLCRSIGFDDECITQVVMSVDEALSNVIRHAFAGAEGEPIEIELDWTEAQAGVRISIRDRGPAPWGRAVEPGAFVPRGPGEMRPGGLGLHIMTECMDCLEYRPAEGGGTVLTMIKRLEPARGRSR